MTKELEPRASDAAGPPDQVQHSVCSDLQYVSMQVNGRAYGGWYRLLADGRMELLALANMHCERRPESTPLEQARGMLAEFVRAAQRDGRAGAHADGGPSTLANDPENKAQPTTLGDLLYADRSAPRIEEVDWVRLVRSIAAGDQVALDQLFQRAHHIVYTVIMRLILDRDLAEELTLDVFHDVWRQACHYDAAGGPVLAWLLNQARLRALQRLELQQAAQNQAAHAKEYGAHLRDALAALSPIERRLIESAYFSRKNYRELAAEEQRPAEAVSKQLHEGLEKLRESLCTGVAAR